MFFKLFQRFLNKNMTDSPLEISDEPALLNAIIVEESDENCPLFANVKFKFFSIEILNLL